MWNCRRTLKINLVDVLLNKRVQEIFGRKEMLVDNCKQKTRQVETPGCNVFGPGLMVSSGKTEGRTTGEGREWTYVRQNVEDVKCK